jgi:hypothetical protein
MINPVGKELNEALGTDSLAGKEKCDVCNCWLPKKKLHIDKDGTICRECWIKEQNGGEHGNAHPRCKNIAESRQQLPSRNFVRSLEIETKDNGVIEITLFANRLSYLTSNRIKTGELR